MEPKDVIVFEQNSIRRTWVDGELWFAASDIIAAMAKAKEPAAKNEPEKPSE